MFLSKKGKLTILAPVGCLQVHLAPLYTANIYSTVATMLHYFWLIDSQLPVFLLLLIFSLANTTAPGVPHPRHPLSEEEGLLPQVVWLVTCILRRCQVAAYGFTPYLNYLGPLKSFCGPFGDQIYLGRKMAPQKCKIQKMVKIREF